MRELADACREAGLKLGIHYALGRDWDTPPYWSTSTLLIRHLVDIAGKGGNYLLNSGPDGNGAVPPASRERLAAIAAWMAFNAGSIHGTSARSLAAPEWRRFTQRGRTLYAPVLDWPELPREAPDQTVTVIRIQLQ